MKNYRSFSYLCLISLSLWASLQSCSPKKAATESAKEASGAGEYYTVEDFTSVEKYDVHVHVYTTDTALIAQGKKDHFKLLQINVDAPSLPPLEEQQDFAVRHLKAFPQQVSFASTISVQHFHEAGWQNQTITALKDAFARGAVGVKVWKNIGMELKDKDGNFVMIDHPQFDPVLDYIAKNKITLLSHQGEPRNCWLPVEEMTVEGDKKYFREHPQYHMYLHPEYPSYEEQIKARDHMIEKHPDLKVVSVHLASLEWNLDELARRLDKYPNMAVDMAARIPHLHNHSAADWQKVHDFFIKYQDRLLYGTDLSISAKSNPAEVQKNAHEVWLNDWKFFTTDEEMTNSSKMKFRGLKLPREVVNKIYAKNARKWIPGIASSDL